MGGDSDAVHDALYSLASVTFLRVVCVAELMAAVRLWGWGWGSCSRTVSELLGEVRFLICLQLSLQRRGSWYISLSPRARQHCDMLRGRRL